MGKNRSMGLRVSVHSAGRRGRQSITCLSYLVTCKTSKGIIGLAEGIGSKCLR